MTDATGHSPGLCLADAIGSELNVLLPPQPGDPTADDGKLGTNLYYAVNMVVLAGVPAAIATSPSALTMPLDLVLGIALPLHAHIGMNYGELLLLLSFQTSFRLQMVSFAQVMRIR